MTGRWWHGYAAAAALTGAIAVTAFVAHRNDAFAARELERARAAAATVASGGPPSAEVVAAGLVSSAAPSPEYPFLRQRQVDGRALGGPDAPELDKTLYDAAGRAERSGAFAVLERDGSRAIAALPTAGGIAVAVTAPPSGPASAPLWIVLGLLVMGALVTATGAMVGGAARPAGLALGLSGLAVPTYLWGGAAPAAAIAGIALVAAACEQRGLTARAVATLREGRLAYSFLAPAAAAMLVLVAIPFAVGLALGFYNHASGEWSFVGLDNFVHILSGGDRPLSDPLNFWFTFAVTVLWTAANVFCHVSIGVALALVLRQSWLGGRGVFRVLLILPWAIPNYITALLWRGMFQTEYGALNAVLEAAGLAKVSWFSDWSTAFAANLCTNTWLGFPFMMVVALGALESIPRDMSEAAEVDGASAWQRFVHITLPHLRPAMTPAIALGAIWTFNMFNVIYLVSEGRPGGGTDILVTEAYRWAFERGERYGLAAAYATTIFLILVAWTALGARLSRKGGEA